MRVRKHFWTYSNTRISETQSVPVVGWQTNQFPAFYTRDSGLPVPHRVEDAESAAQIHLARRELGQGGTLLVAPIPTADELDPTEINRVIEESLNDLLQKNFRTTSHTACSFRS